ncbi:hypothetical protein EON62_02335 [archaeon]|nr:MAG: hypothetical protein EON62_02335 [archaeon]
MQRAALLAEFEAAGVFVGSATMNRLTEVEETKTGVAGEEFGSFGAGAEGLDSPGRDMASMLNAKMVALLRRFRFARQEVERASLAFESPVFDIQPSSGTVRWRV